MTRRLVFHCLLELCRCRAKGIVEHAVLLGAPVGVTPERWALARSVVAGRLVNGYSPQDWVCAPRTAHTVHGSGPDLESVTWSIHPESLTNRKEGCTRPYSRLE